MCEVKVLTWMCWSQSIKVNVLGDDKLNVLKWKCCSECVELNMLQWMSWRESVEVNVLKWMCRIESVAVNVLKSMCCSECVELNTLQWMSWRESFEVNVLMKWMNGAPGFQFLAELCPFSVHKRCHLEGVTLGYIQATLCHWHLQATVDGNTVVSLWWYYGRAAQL